MVSPNLNDDSLGTMDTIIYTILGVSFLLFIFKLGSVTRILFLALHKFNLIPKEVDFDFILDIVKLKIRTYISMKLGIGHLIKHRSGANDLVYYDGMDKYVIRFPRRRGRYPFDEVTGMKDEFHSEDATDDIKLFAGPNGNFHGIPTTSSMLGYRRLVFMSSSQRYTYDANDIITYDPQENEIVK